MGRLPRTDAGNPLRAYLKEQRRIQRQQGYSSAFARSGLNVTAEGQLSSDDFDGDIPNGDAGTQGWGASGDTLAAGNLLLRPRSIGDDALSSLVRGDFMGKTENNFTVPAGGRRVASNAIQVPDGFTGALVTVTCDATAHNTSAGSDFIYVSTIIETQTLGGYGGSAFTQIGAGSWGSSSTSGVLMSTGIAAGSVVTCAINVSSNAGWSADAINVANMNATIIWFR